MRSTKAEPKSKITTISAFIVYEICAMFVTFGVTSSYLESYTGVANIFFRFTLLLQVLFTVF